MDEKYLDNEGGHMLYYPEIYIPESFIEIFNSYGAKFKKPVKPTPPTEPSKPSRISEIMPIPLQLFISAIIIAISVALFNNENFILLYFFAIIGGVFVLCTLGSIIYSFERHNNYNEYVRKKSEYDRDLKEYNYNLKKYREIVEKHIRENTPKLSSLVHFTNITDAVGMHNRTFTSGLYSEVSKGITEDFFFDYLSEHLRKIDRFECHIFKNTKVDVNSEQAYYPDIVMKIGNICFDIEIDEPYTLTDKFSIHYEYICYTEWDGFSLPTGDYVYCSLDENRNKFFTDNNWVVIRFAEEQICRWPEDCVKTIQIVAESILSPFSPLYFNEKLKLPIQTIKKWDPNDAQRMARDNYRDTYASEFIKAQMQNVEQSGFEIDKESDNHFLAVEVDDEIAAMFADDDKDDEHGNNDGLLEIDDEIAAMFA